MVKRIGDTQDDATRRAIGALLDLYEHYPELRSRTAVGGGLAVAHWVGPRTDLGSLNTADIDMVVDVVVGEVYKDLRKSLLKSGLWIQRNPKKPFAFWRKAKSPAEEVEIDFQGSPFGGAHIPGGKDIYKEVGDLKTRILEGGDLALKHAVGVSLAGTGPDGGEIRGQARIVEAFILVPMKAVAFRNRGLPVVDPAFRTLKDAADLFALLRVCGPDALAKASSGYRNRVLMRDAIDALEAHFGRPSGRGGEGADAVVDYFQGRIAEGILRSQVADLVSRYLKALGPRT